MALKITTLRNMRRRTPKVLTHNCDRREFTRLCAASFLCLASAHLTGCSGEKQDNRLVVACGNDIGGLTVQAALEWGMASEVNFDADEAFIGDCCGSTATFTLSSGKVDVAVLCPDAVVNLKEANEDFIELGTVVFDGNLLVSPTGNFETCTNVGYMADRDEQKADIQAYLGQRELSFRPLYTFATASALANGLVEAATMDLASAARAGYPSVAYTKDRPTSVLVARGSLSEDERLLQLVQICNSYLSLLQEEGEELTQKLCELFENDNKDEVMSWWQNSTTGFGSELKIGE